MSTSYPITLPDRPGFSRSSFRPRNVVAMSASPFTGQQQTFKHQGEWWEVALSLPSMRGANAAEWEAALVSLQGMAGTFLLGDPDRPTPRGAGTGSPVANSAGSPPVNTARSRTLYIRGATPNVTNWLMKADYIQIDTGAASRLVKALSNASTDSSGETAIEIWPALYSDITDGTVITVQNPKGVFRLTADIEWSTDAAKTYGFTFSARSEI